MRLTYFRIENFRNLALAECEDPPDLMVVCGGNGCGKSALLHGIMAAKEHAAPYGGFQMDPRSVSADSEMAQITLRVAFSELERRWYKDKYRDTCPGEDEIVIQIEKGGRARALKRSPHVRNLLSWYLREYRESPGFFDYIDAHRVARKRDLTTWDSQALSDQRSKQHLGAVGTEKFSLTKEYLASLVMRDAHEMLAARREKREVFPDSLKDVRQFFDSFFSPLKFKDVRLDCSPFKFIVETPKGEVDVDDLSSGEKEILNTFVHFHRLNPKQAVILFDEVDAHLHPDLERRYLSLFQEMAKENQIILTTHSPEIMIAAGSESLFTIAKSSPEGVNQLSRVTTNDELHGALSDVMGSNGMSQFQNRFRIVNRQAR